MAEGDGPVNALDAALRAALVRYYRQLEDVHLTDYKVRIIDSTSGTAARTRVLIESSDGTVRMGHRRRQRQHRGSQPSGPRSTVSNTQLVKNEKGARLKSEVSK